MKFRGGSKVEKIAPQMAPMIDVVFQLLIFFMLTLKIVAPEGEFGINMPLGAGGNPTDSLLPEINVRVLATPAGELGSLQLNGVNLGNDDAAFAELTSKIRAIAGDPSDATPNEDLSVTIDPDYDLNYRWFIKTVGSVSGDKLPDGTTVPLVGNIKFAQARDPR
ncbi:ExbD/TolR family protein [Alienimonas californiensis]|uniref:Biopolymer transport protein ExbD/TolR n=1 Tax=Alienimonas californiensis TaxID=2527989 RepID=A0A517P6G7_9PLAN|nr:biopolymer transporter ExbD [Alienimonas californiensis]QDT14943.1 Biopolymer transport protein ExbD/TolR [Alienimonas californiensis]